MSGPSTFRPQRGCATASRCVSPSERHRLIVCSTCRLDAGARTGRERRNGARWQAALAASSARWATREGFAIVPHACLSVCPRPCAVAFAAPGKYTYVFEDFIPGGDDAAVIECATQSQRAPVEYLPRDQRPPALRAAILARVPPWGDA